MVFACVFVLVGLENLLYTCIMYVLYIVLVPGTVHVHLYNSMYNIYICTMVVHYVNYVYYTHLLLISSFLSNGKRCVPATKF